MSTRSRPLSPHLQIYRLPGTALLSITHRVTGIGIAIGTLVLVWWLAALASGPAYFDWVHGLLGSWVGRLLLLGWTWAIFYHFCNGIRHLVWDTGRGLDLPTVRASGFAVVLFSLALTLGLWLAAYMARGG